MIINIILITTLLLLFADFLFLNYLWMNFSDSLFNIFNVLLIIFLLVSVSCAAVKLFIVFSERNNKSKKLLSFVSVIILFVGIGFVFSSSTKYQKITGFINISAKETDESGDYFLVLNNSQLNKFVRVKCSEKTYNEIETDDEKLYNISYRIGSFNDDYGALESISEF